jgi:hypothetical protein
MQSDVKSAAGARGETAGAKPPTFTRRIGSTAYRVSIHFNGASAETAEDKILRLMKGEAREIV